MNQQEFIEGKDYYFNEEGFMVLTEFFLKERGYCCDMGCLHCPYKRNTTQEKELKDIFKPPEDDIKNSG
jgi:hypothetical protein